MKKKTKAARISKFLNANMKGNAGGAICEFIRWRDMSKRLAESKVTAMDYLAGNLTEQCRCGEVRELESFLRHLIFRRAEFIEIADKYAMDETPRKRRAPAS